MGRTTRSSVAVRPVDGTLKWVVVQYRILVCLWALVLIAVTLYRELPGNHGVLYAGGALAVSWTGFTIWASRTNRILGSLWFVALDGAVVLLLSAGGAIAGTDDFFSGGFPGSWLFVVAFATNLRWTMVASLVLLGEHAVLHDIMDLGAVRTAGTFQFPVLGLIIGWAFDALRQREALRLAAEQQLAAEQEASARHQERAALAQRLHDSVLQTLHAIRTHAEDPMQVRYAARRQERELRRTIEDLSSPYEKSYRAALMEIRDEVEDLFPSVEIDVLVRSDTEVDGTLEVGLKVTREAMVNAAKHSGQLRIDVYSEIANGIATTRVRDRGNGIDPDAADRILRGKERSMLNRLSPVGGTARIDSGPDTGTEVTIEVPIS
ncbi:MAG TPA: ATP-binding protein [Acidimicrobiia bacterium]|nr:ATP-binding protein [Acidimicrobiia bacterium]